MNQTELKQMIESLKECNLEVSKWLNEDHEEKSKSFWKGMINARIQMIEDLEKFLED